MKSELIKYNPVKESEFRSVKYQQINKMSKLIVVLGATGKQVGPVD